MANIVKATSEDKMTNHMSLLFKKHFPDFSKNDKYFKKIVSAPGRVNLIGEHTDYNEGYVFPMAIEFRTYIIGCLNDTKHEINIISENIDAPNNSSTFSLMNIEKLDQKSLFSWSNYVRGVIKHFHNLTKLKGFNLVISSEVPLGGGLSSSASLEVATYTFLEAISDSKIDLETKAKLCQKAEHTYADAPCGIMDQLISTTAKQGFASLIDCRSISYEFFEISDPNLVILISNSNVKHSISGNDEYSKRKEMCNIAAIECNEKSLRNVSFETLKSHSHRLEGGKLDWLTYKRAFHVIAEISRTYKAAQSLKQSDFIQFGKFMNESHVDLRDNYQVSIAELDYLVALAISCEGVYGSRMTGGGFGGCTVSLVDKSKVDKVVEFLDKEYYKKFGIKPTFYTSVACCGAKVIQI